MDKGQISIAKKSQAKEIFSRFVQNKAAVVGLIIILVFVSFALFPELFARYGYDDQDLSRQFLPPSWEHPFGTDDYGRDIFSRVVYGSRISLVIGVFSITFSCAVGVLIGSVAGYYSSTIDNILMRAMDIMLAMPSILLAIAIVAAMGVGFQNLIIAIGVASIPQYARIVRASVLSIKDQEYIEAARSIGASNLRIIFHHILPNCLAPIIVQATMS
ncbi:MAG: ABC transporter permease, partial [Bacillota bacterium]|nr:ABC transporter permease [Bacillota bacterium]